MKTITCTILLLGFVRHVNAADYSGNNVTQILGVGINSPQFKEIKAYWVLNKEYASTYSGIKLYINDITDKVESIVIAGEGLTIENERFYKYTAKLPFKLSFNDDSAAVESKLGIGEKMMGRSTLKFYEKGIAVEVTYSHLRNWRISSLKLYKTDHANSLPAPVTPVVAAVVPGKTTVTTPAVTKATVPVSPFKHAILEVFKASHEATFASVKAGERSQPNFWNYKYTYNTNLTVPGQEYNMLYNFPFAYSQTDFVVVIKEADHYDESFDSMYHRVERELNANFKINEGWTSACISGSNKTKLPDLELRNEKIGSIILDCSQNPRGRQVLYLRFLFFSN